MAKKKADAKPRDGRPEKTASPGVVKNICRNAECRLRKAGCRGFEGCPGYRGG